MHDPMSMEIPIIKKQILLVEDESVFANAVRKHLLRKEYDISLANDLKSARQYIKENIPDLILLDMRLPDGSGLDLLNEIKSFAFRDKDQKVKFNLQRDFVENLDNLPMPAWDLIDITKFGMKLDNYYNPKNLPLKFKSALFSSRACPCLLYTSPSPRYRG